MPVTHTHCAASMSSDSCAESSDVGHDWLRRNRAENMTRSPSRSFSTALRSNFGHAPEP